MSPYLSHAAKNLATVEGLQFTLGLEQSLRDVRQGVHITVQVVLTLSFLLGKHGYTVSSLSSIWWSVHVEHWRLLMLDGHWEGRIAEVAEGSNVQDDGGWTFSVVLNGSKGRQRTILALSCQPIVNAITPTFGAKGGREREIGRRVRDPAKILIPNHTCLKLILPSLDLG